MKDIIYSLSGIEIMPTPLWPKNKPIMGTFVSRAHPFVEWLAKYLHFDPNTYFQNVEIGKTWKDPVVADKSVWSINGTGGLVILCHPEQAEKLRKVALIARS